MTGPAEDYDPPAPVACHDETVPDGGLRAPDGPLMTGDVLDGRKVLGFTCAARGLPASADDLLLFEGDDHADSLPRPGVVAVSRQPGVERVGPHPCRQLEAEHVHRADELAPGLAGAFDELVYGPDAPRYLAPLIDRLTGSGHGFWLVGGAPRDLVAGARPGEIGDLDTTGTAPAGSFCDVTDQVLGDDGLSDEHPRRFSPHSLVCSILPPQREGLVLDYRGMGVGGLPWPATGTDLRRDGRQRDLTVNTLLYDPVRHLVLDPLERALDDLAHRGGSRRLVPAGLPDDPETCAAVLLRSLKFRLRWEPDGGGPGRAGVLDDTALRDWAAALPEDLVARLDDGGGAVWQRLRALAATCLPPGGPSPALSQVVREYGAATAALVGRLTGPESD
ncbi:hypothetical protein [Streptomyces sp. NBC_01637]|uniref:hypothetical protein n=1 Tax=unclassified Streptomyces TaxID=2593676 RepID=UPI00386F31F3|nr:hypothetical protein OH719_38940 [Streptomyces sp. NBC_01653]WTD87539.1 hypothetical protein OG891_07925 [Streptomyces sp. NBC_01637]